ncbi:MAG: type II toxin-antitoxin system VapC family toxin [Acidobacteria bacterium]|nr:type II toxin-antitoxin system VapC family toxin [Acidobacteriota bacterium]
MVYVDSNIFIFALLADDKNSERCKSILTRIANGELTAFTSTLTWDEIVWCAQRYLGLDDALQAGKRFLDFPFLSVLDATEPVLRRAQDVMEQYGLKPRDAIHVATALARGIGEILSEDNDLDIVKELKRTSLRRYS